MGPGFKSQLLSKKVTTQIHLARGVFCYEQVFNAILKTMKRFWLIASVVLISIAWTQPSLAADAIKQYDVDITLNSTGQADIKEHIVYNFGNIPGHGIYRSLPYRYFDYFWNDNLDLHLNSVTDDAEQDWPVESVSPSDFNQPAGYKVWRIGSPIVELDGVQTFNLDYTVNWVMQHFSDHSEFYWNAVGTEWNVPIDEVTITVHTPHQSLSADFIPTCYAGPYGDDIGNCNVTTVGDDTIFTVQNLDSYTGVTIVMPFVPGAIQQPSWEAMAWHLFSDNWSILFIPLILLLPLILFWRDRPAHPTEPLIPQYEAPANVPPYLAEFMLKGKASVQSFTASLIELARTGHVHFVYDEKTKKISSLKKLKAAAAEDIVGAEVLKAVFKVGNEVILKNTVLNQTTLFSTMNSASKAVALKEKWFDPARQRWYTASSIFSAVFVLCGIYAIVQGASSMQIHYIVVGITGLLVGSIFPLFHLRYRPLTIAGANLAQQLNGFKWFLRVTETERVKFSQAPKLTPELFEQFLPYAIIFGVEKQWIAQFKDILVTPPTWLEGGPNGYMALNYALLATRSTPNYFKTPVTTSAHSSGGSGFSGGGFGGGGGGRW